MLIVNNTKIPLVSIVLCTYNGALHLSAQLDSIIAQTYPNIEIIAIDDCSTDNTVDILHQYAERYKNFKIIQNNTNIGYVKNFEKGMVLCKGNFMALCDQDDVWEHNKIAAMMENIGDYNLVYCNSELVDANLNSLHKKMSDIKNLATYNNALPFVIGNCVPGHAILMTRALLNLAAPFPNYIIHDHWLAYIASLYGGVKYINTVLVKHRNHTNNAVGAVHLKRKKGTSFYTRFNEKRKRREIVCKKIELFYAACNVADSPEKEVLYNLMISYKSFSLKNNIKRMRLFLKYRGQLLAIKKRSAFRKWIFCYKMFFKKA